MFSPKCMSNLGRLKVYCTMCIVYIGLDRPGSRQNTWSDDHNRQAFLRPIPNTALHMSTYFRSPVIINISLIHNALYSGLTEYKYFSEVLSSILNSKSFFSVDWVLCLAAHAPWLLTERVVSRLVEVWQTALTPPHLLLLTLFSPATRHLFITSAQPHDSWQKVSSVPQACSSGGSRCRLSRLTNSALVFEPKCRGTGVGGGVAASQPTSAAIYRSPNKIWRSNSIFNLCVHPFSSSLTQLFRFNIPTMTLTL